MNLRHETNKIFTSSNKPRLENKICYQATPTQCEYSKYSRFCSFFVVVGCNFHKNSSHNFILRIAQYLLFTLFLFKNLIQKFITHKTNSNRNNNNSKKKVIKITAEVWDLFKTLVCDQHRHYSQSRFVISDNIIGLIDQIMYWVNVKKESGNLLR